MKKLTYKLSEIDALAAQLAFELGACNVVTLSGSLGAGKTTFSGALLRQLGVREPVISPTFTYVNQYAAADGRQIYHFDLYRLKNRQEFESAGFFEYLDQPNSLVLIEWPEIVDPVLAGRVCRINITSTGSQERVLEYQIKN